MKIKLSDPVLDYENKPIEVPPENKPLTFFDVFINSLNSQIPNGEILTAEKKNQIYQISKKMYDNRTEANFTPEQLSLIKERVGKTYAPMVYGKVLEVIDGVEPPKTEAPEQKPN